MKIKLPTLIGGLVVVFILIVGVIIFQKSQVKPETGKEQPQTQTAIKKVDLSTQPQWVQDLKVTLTTGRSANGLKSFTFKVDGMPKDLVSNVNYVVQYETTNKGAQGALSTKPIEVNGATTLSRTVDFGTCSTKTCVTHDGVTSVDLELDFTTTSSDQFTWTKTLDL